MTRKSYRKQLADLRSEVVAMADTTLDRYAEAVGLLESGDSATAERIIQGDFELNEWYLEIESDCIELLARQQPVAGDLRFIASSFKIVTDLERIGDLATNLAAYGRDADGDLPHASELTEIAEMAAEMVADSMEAYAQDDADATREIATRDDTLDSRCRDASEMVIRELVDARIDDRANVEPLLEDASHALLTIRDIERVGDHAVNICARTLYMTEYDDELIY